jgi:flagellar hook assembly protein FlgD
MIFAGIDCKRASLIWGMTLIFMSFTTSAFSQINLETRKDGAASGDKLGWAVAGVGDINGDGVPDYIVGAPYSDPSGLTSAGSAFVFSGADGTLLYQKNGTSKAEGLGYWVAGAGDVNGDSRPDFIVASQNQAFIYSGANGALLYRKSGGGPVAGAGDLNGDGRADFLVSSVSQTSVYSGADGALLYQKAGGSAIDGLGDIDGDGRSDFIVCDQYADPGLTNAGSAYVYSGATGVLLYQKDGAVSSDLFGSSAAGVGDINGDGVPDFIIGARLADIGGFINAGAAYVYSGATGALLFRKNGAAGEQWGESVSGAGDVDGDGRDDFMIGSIWANPGGLSSAGSVFVISGATGALLYQANGTIAYENFGYSLSKVGDLSGNGRSEFIVGGPNASPGGLLYAGSAYIYGQSGGSDPCNPDIVPPSLVCHPDKRITCGQTVVFDEPTATDNCDYDPTINVVSTTQASGPGVGEITHTRTWTAIDMSGNVSAPCSQNVIYYCEETSSNRSQIAESSNNCASFMSGNATDLTGICCSVRNNKISKSVPSTFLYYILLTAPGASFTVEILQSRDDAGVPYFGIARNGITVYDNCTAIGTGNSTDSGQGQVRFTGASVGKTYVIAVKYTASSLNGFYVGPDPLVVHYDFVAQLDGAEITRDPDGLDLRSCSRMNHLVGPGTPAAGLVIGNYPNPFNASTQIRFALVEDGVVQIEIFNVLGQKVRTLVDEFKIAGEYSIIWDGSDGSGGMVATGIYFCRISTTYETEIIKLNMIK